MMDGEFGDMVPDKDRKSGYYVVVLGDGSTEIAECVDGWWFTCGNDGNVAVKDVLDGPFTPQQIVDEL